MQSDKELLMLAAKAGGYEVMGPVEKFIVQPNSEHIGGLVIANDHGGHSAWNSLRCDADAMRLFVRLRMDVTFNEMDVFAFPQDGSDGASELINVDDPYAATREAITRAASQIAQAAQLVAAQAKEQ